MKTSTAKYLVTAAHHTTECLDEKYKGEDELAHYRKHLGAGRCFALSPGSNAGYDVGQAYDAFVLDHLNGDPGVYNQHEAWGIKFSVRDEFKRVERIPGPKPWDGNTSVYKHRTKPILLITNTRWTRYGGRYLVFGEEV